MTSHVRLSHSYAYYVACQTVACTLNPAQMSLLSHCIRTVLNVIGAFLAFSKCDIKNNAKNVTKSILRPHSRQQKRHLWRNYDYATLESRDNVDTIYVIATLWHATTKHATSVHATKFHRTVKITCDCVDGH
jgi:hypothetical protein